MRSARLALPALALALAGLVSAVSAAEAAPEAAPVTTAAAQPAIPFDFNGDGYADLVVGVPFEEVDHELDAGAVNVIYGSASGLDATGNQSFSQASAGIEGKREGCRRCEGVFGDEFGAALASGDFDRDGFADLAAGVPNDRAGGTADAGAVNVIYGSAHGLRAARNQRWSFGNLPGDTHQYDEFGSALAAADLNADGYPDLAISVRNGSAGAVAQAGTVIVLLGGPAGLDATGLTTLTRAMTGEPDLPEFAFGAALASGDLDGDGVADLVVGAPDYRCTGGGLDLRGSASLATIGASACAAGGEIDVFYGGSFWPLGARIQRWTLDSPGVPGDAAPDDFLGAALAVGDFNGDGDADVAAGSPRKKVADCGSHCSGQGAVLVLFGGDGGLVADASQFWHLDVPGVPRAAEPLDDFGVSLAAGDFDGDGNDELVVGCPTKAVGGAVEAGAILVLRGSSVTGPTTVGARLWTQRDAGMPGRVAAWRRFGMSLATDNYGRSGRDDLAIGVPGDRAGGVPGAGRVIVLYGQASGLSTTHVQSWSQAMDGIKGVPERLDGFGWTLGN